MICERRSYVRCPTDKYAGKAYDMQEALNTALSSLNNQPQRARSVI